MNSEDKAPFDATSFQKEYKEGMALADEAAEKKLHPPPPPKISPRVEAIASIVSGIISIAITIYFLRFLYSLKACKTANPKARKLGEFFLWVQLVLSILLILASVIKLFVKD